MALDIIDSFSGRYIHLPENLRFNVGYEPTRMKDKNYVINQETDEVIGICLLYTSPSPRDS